MTLKTADVSFEGKAFRITAMPALQAEKWAIRLMLALTKGGVEIPDDAVQQGAAAIMSAGALSLGKIAWEDAEPLLDEMMTCVKLVPDPKHPEFERAIQPSDLDDMMTVMKLRAEVIELHTGFSVAAALSTLGAAAKRRAEQSGTQTSRPTSEPSSAAD